jgi:hypothetical protein
MHNIIIYLTSKHNNNKRLLILSKFIFNTNNSLDYILSNFFVHRTNLRLVFINCEHQYLQIVNINIDKYPLKILHLTLFKREMILKGIEIHKHIRLPKGHLIQANIN